MATRVTRSELAVGRSQPHIASPAATTSAAASAATTPFGARPAGLLQLAPCASDGSAVSAAANSAAVANLSAGSLASAVSTAYSTAGGTVSRSVDTAVGLSLMTFATTACTLDPVNGGSPVSISFVTAP